jgi:lipopolysaccharide transport system ATP-binding protein
MMPPATLKTDALPKPPVASPPGVPDASPRAAPAPPAPEAPAAKPPVVACAQNLGKRFKIYRRPVHRMREWILGGKHHTEFWAVRGVTFEVRRGECMGIIGANGSGKSTLLKMVAGALRQSEGSFRVQGRVLSLIELGAGLNQMLTGRANIIHAAALLGFPASFAREKMQEIERFADIGEFFDRPVMLYSSGMRVRLAFSMFACFRPELFIVDEALSVGDIFFQQKCATRIRELLDGGMTMLFVSHDQSAILNLCDHAMVMSKGSPIFYGAPEEAVTCYLASLRHDGRVRSRWERKTVAEDQTAPSTTARSDPGDHAAPATATGVPPPSRRLGPAHQILAHDIIGDRREHRHGSGKATILACRTTDAAGKDNLRTSVGQVLCFHLLIEAHDHIESPRAGIRFFDRFNNLVFGAGTYQKRYELPPLAPGQRLIVRFQVTMDLGPGQYTFGLGVGEPDGQSAQAGVPLDRLDLLGPIIVRKPDDGHRPFHGIAQLPMKVTHTPLSAPEETN